MNVVKSDLPEVLILEPKVFGDERGLFHIWNDPDLNVPWPLDGEPILSQKDRAGLPFKHAEVFP